MKDRLPTYPGRVTLTPVEGQANTYDMVRADEPTEEGTPLNKANLLKNTTAALYWPNGDGPEDPTVDDAFFKTAKYIETDSPKPGDIHISISPNAPGADWCLANGTLTEDSTLAPITGIRNVAPTSEAAASTSVLLPMPFASGNGYVLFLDNLSGSQIKIFYAPVADIKNGSLDYVDSAVELTDKLNTISHNGNRFIVVLFWKDKFIYSTHETYGVSGYTYYSCENGSFQFPTDDFSPEYTSTASNPVRLYNTSFIVGDYLFVNGCSYQTYDDFDWTGDWRTYAYKVTLTVGAYSYEVPINITDARYIDGEYYFTWDVSYSNGTYIYYKHGVCKCSSFEEPPEILYQTSTGNTYYWSFTAPFKIDNEIYFVLRNGLSTTIDFQLEKIIDTETIESVPTVGTSATGITGNGSVHPVMVDTGDQVFAIFGSYDGFTRNQAAMVCGIDKNSKMHTFNDQGTVIGNQNNNNWLSGLFVDDDFTVRVFAGNANGNGTLRYTLSSPILRTKLPTVSVSGAYAYVKYTNEVINDDPES